MEPVINLEEQIGKTVGRCRWGDGFEYGMKLQKSGAKLSKTFSRLRIQKGVYRFHSHEEADAWMMKQLTKANPS